MSQPQRIDEDLLAQARTLLAEQRQAIGEARAVLVEYSREIAPHLMLLGLPEVGAETLRAVRVTAPGARLFVLAEGRDAATRTRRPGRYEALAIGNDGGFYRLLGRSERTEPLGLGDLLEPGVTAALRPWRVEEVSDDDLDDTLDLATMAIREIVHATERFVGEPLTDFSQLAAEGGRQG